MATGLKEEEKEAIQINWNPILTSLKVGFDDIKHWLYQKRFFTDTVKEDIESGLTPQEKAEKLLAVVRDTDNPQGFSLFTQALEETNHKPTAQLLQEAAQVVNRQEVKLQRPEDGKFGFKFVPGSGVQRARFEGDDEYYITKIIPNKLAAKSGELREYDTIVCINQVPIGKMEFDKVEKLFDDSAEIVLTIKRYKPTHVGSFEAFLAQQLRPENIEA